MSKRPIATALISVDESVRSALQAAGLEVRFAIDVPFAQLGKEDVEELEASTPELIVLDLDAGPELGLGLVQFLTESDPARPVVVVGRDVSPELLMTSMQAGAAEFVTKPLGEDALLAMASRIERRLNRGGAAHEEEVRGKVLTLVGAKGGAGTSMIAVNLATEIRRRTGASVVLVDLDLALGDLSVQLRLQPRYDIVDLVRNLHRMDPELLATFMEPHPSGVHLLAAPDRDPDKEAPVASEQLQGVLRLLARHYAYVVVDAANRFPPRSFGALAESDKIFLVTTPDLPSLRNTKRLLPVLDRLGVERDRVRLVLNRYEAGRSMPPDELERTFGTPVAATIANDYLAVTQSINEGSPVVLEGSARSAQDLQKLAGTLTAGDRPTSDGGGWSVRSLALGFRRGQKATGRGKG